MASVFMRHFYITWTEKYITNLHLTANNEKYGNVRLGGAVVEVYAADDDHAEGDDDGDAAGDGAADGPQQQQDHLHHEVHHVPRGFVRVPDSPEQRVV